MITAEQVKALREETGLSIMQVKKALEEANGDMDQARAILRENSTSAALKKADRELGSGIVSSYVHATREMGAMITLSCETDFVAKTEDFIALADDLAKQVAAMSPSVIKRDEGDDRSGEEVLMEQPFLKNHDMTVSEMIAGATQKLGERIEVTEMIRFSIK